MPAEPFLSVRGLRKVYSRRRWWGADPNPVVAVRDVDLSLERGRILGLVGPSGSGKSTVARCLTRLEVPDAGDVRLEGRSALRPEIQLIFQDAASSLNPRFSAAEVLEEPLLIQRRGTRKSRQGAAARTMEQVGLPLASFHQKALAFSGGERQRLAIARALVTEPKLLILDESFSSLDIGLQNQLGSLLAELQRRLGLTCILISHDLSLVGRLSDDIAVMEDGCIVEVRPAGELMRAPHHPLTAELVRANRALSLGGGS